MMHRRTSTIAVLLILGGSACALSDDVESHYEGVKAARDRGAFDHGWLPEIIPSDATDIWELHNIDTNWTWACFRTASGPEAVRALLAQKGAVQMSGPVDKGPSYVLRTYEWWPASMNTPAIETYSFQEPSRHSSTKVGLDVRTGVVCFHGR
jgi:hypothetical protein